jgi:hypothetical protein
VQKSSHDLTYISELNDPHLAEFGKTVMSGILVYDEGDILHRLGTEPSGHLSIAVLLE